MAKTWSTPETGPVDDDDTTDPAESIFFFVFAFLATAWAWYILTAMLHIAPLTVLIAQTAITVVVVLALVLCRLCCHVAVVVSPA